MGRHREGLCWKKRWEPVRGRCTENRAKKEFVRLRESERWKEERSEDLKCQTAPSGSSRQHVVHYGGTDERRSGEQRQAEAQCVRVGVHECTQEQSQLLC